MAVCVTITFLFGSNVCSLFTFTFLVVFWLIGNEVLMLIFTLVCVIFLVSIILTWIIGSSSSSDELQLYDFWLDVFIAIAKYIVMIKYNFSSILSNRRNVKWVLIGSKAWYISILSVSTFSWDFVSNSKY